jgi:hypothetical protein
MKITPEIVSEPDAAGFLGALKHFMQVQPIKRRTRTLFNDGTTTEWISTGEMKQIVKSYLAPLTKNH